MDFGDESVFQRVLDAHKRKPFTFNGEQVNLQLERPFVQRSDTLLVTNFHLNRPKLELEKRLKAIFAPFGKIVRFGKGVHMSSLMWGILNTYARSTLKVPWGAMLHPV